MDIILQGPIYKNTIKTAIDYSNLWFVQRVIISTWTNETVSTEFINNTKIKVVKSEVPKIINGVTMNCQIVSSKEGLNHCTQNIVAKMRSDQKISDESMIKMFEYFIKHESSGKLFVLGINYNFPFHPQDHVFWGFFDDVWCLFDIPLMPDELHSLNFDEVYRFPIYLGAHYCAQFSAQIYHYLSNYKEYLVDGKTGAMETSNRLIDQYFKAFPRINMYWEKYNSGYWYNEYYRQGERYGEW